MMKILFINASPRQKGIVTSMLSVMKAEAERRGAETDSVRISDLTVQPCTGCMACRTKGDCVLPPDDARRVLEKIRACDALVVGAPCYWGDMPGHLKLLFDRLVYGLIDSNAGALPKPLHAGKRAVIVSASTTPWPFNILFRQTRGTVKAIGSILKYSGFRLAAIVERGGTRKNPCFTPHDEARCRKAVSKLWK